MGWEPGAAIGGSLPSLKFQGKLFRGCMDWKTMRWKKSSLDVGGARKQWEKSILSIKHKCREHAHIWRTTVILKCVECPGKRQSFSVFPLFYSFFFFKEIQCQGTSSLALGQIGLLLWLVPSRPGLAVVLRSWALIPGCGLPKGFTPSSVGKESVQYRRPRFNSWVGKTPWTRKW